MKKKHSLFYVSFSYKEEEVNCDSLEKYLETKKKRIKSVSSRPDRSRRRKTRKKVYYLSFGIYRVVKLSYHKD